MGWQKSRMILKSCNSQITLEPLCIHPIVKHITVHPYPKSRTAANCNGIQPMESSPSAKGWMLGRPHFLALSKQQVLEQGVNSNLKTAHEYPSYGLPAIVPQRGFRINIRHVPLNTVLPHPEQDTGWTDDCRYASGSFWMIRKNSAYG